MKNSHIFERMNNPKVVKGYLHTILYSEYDIATELYNNITVEALDHPRYQAIKDAYDNRQNVERNKK